MIRIYDIEVGKTYMIATPDGPQYIVEVVADNICLADNQGNSIRINGRTFVGKVIYVKGSGRYAWEDMFAGAYRLFGGDNEFFEVSNSVRNDNAVLPSGWHLV